LGILFHLHLPQRCWIESESLAQLALGERARIVAGEPCAGALLRQSMRHAAHLARRVDGDAPLFCTIGDIASLEARIPHLPQGGREPLSDELPIRSVPRLAPNEGVPLPLASVVLWRVRRGVAVPLRW